MLPWAVTDPKDPVASSEETRTSPTVPPKRARARSIAMRPYLALLRSALPSMPSSRPRCSAYMSPSMLADAPRSDASGAGAVDMEGSRQMLRAVALQDAQRVDAMDVVGRSQNGAA